MACVPPASWAVLEGGSLQGEVLAGEDVDFPRAVVEAALWKNGDIGSTTKAAGYPGKLANMAFGDAAAQAIWLVPRLNSCNCCATKSSYTVESLCCVGRPYHPRNHERSGTTRGMQPRHPTVGTPPGPERKCCCRKCCRCCCQRLFWSGYRDWSYYGLARYRAFRRGSIL